jgi:CubicO group peptidase (beta-lactamase class C family)
MQKISFISLFIIPFVFTTTFGFPQHDDVDKENINRLSTNNKVIMVDDSTILDSLIETQMEENNIPGLASCIVKKNTIIWNRCYGYANIEKNLHVYDSTAFLLASVTKTFTGTAIMQLWEQGLFGLDDNINAYLPSGIGVINPYYDNKPIFFRMLMTHTSSIKYNMENSYDPLMTWGDDSPVSLDSFVVNYFTEGGIYYDPANYNNWAPGSRYQYSNEAITLLGYLTGLIADTSFFHYCETNIFKPLKMKHTGWFLSDLDTDNLAIPYTYQFGTYYPIGYFSHPGYPSSLLKSSSSDLARYVMAYINEGELEGSRILNSSTVTLMNTVHYPQIASYIGLIWLLDYRDGKKVWWHRGGNKGCSTWISYSPADTLGIIILSNMSQWETNLDTIYNALYDYGLSIPTGIYIKPRQKLQSFKLSQNYPNPFNPTTMISYQLPRISDVGMSIYNLLGQKIATLVNETQQAGFHHVEWDASGLANGVYYYRIEAGNFVQTRKMIYLK